MKIASIFLMVSILTGPAQTSPNALPPQRPASARLVHRNMVRIPAGEWTPFVLQDGQRHKIRIHPFYLDIHAVTNEEFLQFVRANPQWRRSAVPAVFADNNYLRQWTGDTEIGNAAIRNSPVTNISWFAANAYCKWKGKRLPSMNEWEYAAGAPPVNTMPGKNLTRIILEWYDQPTPAVLPVVESTYKNTYGLYDMHGLVWEWVDDFNSLMPQENGGKADAGIPSFSCGGGSLGTSDKEDYAAYMRYAFRQGLQANYTVRGLGFRCARDAE